MKGRGGEGFGPALFPALRAHTLCSAGSGEARAWAPRAWAWGVWANPAEGLRRGVPFHSLPSLPPLSLFTHCRRSSSSGSSGSGTRCVWVGEGVSEARGRRASLMKEEAAGGERARAMGARGGEGRSSPNAPVDRTRRPRDGLADETINEAALGWWCGGHGEWLSGACMGRAEAEREKKLASVESALCPPPFHSQLFPPLHLLPARARASPFAPFVLHDQGSAADRAATPPLLKDHPTQLR